MVRAGPCIAAVDGDTSQRLPARPAAAIFSEEVRPPRRGHNQRSRLPPYRAALDCALPRREPFLPRWENGYTKPAALYREATRPGTNARCFEGFLRPR